MTSADLLVTWTWAPDEPFVHLLRSAAQSRGLVCRLVDAAGIESVTAEVVNGKGTFRWLLDRASDEHPAFLPLAQWVEHRLGSGPSGSRALNPHGRQWRAADKARMHLELMSAGVRVPHTFILPPYAHHPEIVPDGPELHKLGVPFVVKPANTTGGGNGVLVGVTDIAAIAAARRTHPHDTYLVQETIRPAYLGDFRAWFRVFYVCGRVHLCWWDDRTHVYDPIDPDDERFFGLGILRSTAEVIAGVSGLRFFSTELVMTADESIIAVDYVNEMCDMRLQSNAPNGVPDGIVRAIAGDIVDFVASASAGQGVIP